MKSKNTYVQNPDVLPGKVKPIRHKSLLPNSPSQKTEENSESSTTSFHPEATEEQSNQDHIIAPDGTLDVTRKQAPLF